MEFLFCSIYGEKEVRLIEVETKYQILKIELPILSNALKGLDNGWVLFGGMYNVGILMYNIYKDKFFPGVFKYSKATIHGILYFEKKKILVVVGNEGYFTVYKVKKGNKNKN